MDADALIAVEDAVSDALDDGRTSDEIRDAVEQAIVTWRADNPGRS